MRKWEWEAYNETEQSSQHLTKTISLCSEFLITTVSNKDILGSNHEGDQHIVNLLHLSSLLYIGYLNMIERTIWKAEITTNNNTTISRRERLFSTDTTGVTPNTTNWILLRIRMEVVVLQALQTTGKRRTMHKFISFIHSFANKFKARTY